MASPGWMGSLDLRDQRVTEETLENGANQVEMELDFQAPQAHLDLQDKLFTRQEILTGSLEGRGLRGALDCRVRLDSLALWDQKVTEVTRASQGLG